MSARRRGVCIYLCQCAKKIWLALITHIFFNPHSELVWILIMCITMSRKLGGRGGMLITGANLVCVMLFNQFKDWRIGGQHQYNERSRSWPRPKWSYCDTIIFQNCRVSYFLQTLNLCEKVRINARNTPTYALWQSWHTKNGRAANTNQIFDTPCLQRIQFLVN